MNRQEVIEAALSRYDQLHADWIATLPQWLLEWRKANAERPYIPARRCSIEREPASAIARAMCPYIGFAPLRKKNGT